jgi:hypothetical protein
MRMKRVWKSFRSSRTWLQVMIAVVIAGAVACEDVAEERPTAEPAPVEELAFDLDQVRAEIEVQAPFSRVEVHFVHEDGEVLQAAEDCVTHYLESFDSVFCYGFATQEDFEDARVDTESGGMRRLCWTARADKANPDVDRNSQDGGPFDPRCPSA